MGIPRFFRWIAERYPLILQPLTATTIPHIDNLYLDMNGIIHACTHKNNDDATTKALSKRDVVHAVFHYIDKLFNAIKPKRYFVMAVDGVAPRAKMNQQRSRRFRSAQDREQARHLAIKRGEQVPNEDDVFDSNCITPGTEFMSDLSAHIQYFIRSKMQTDIAWRDCQVIFSGHDVPGEGEHKIMEFIRGRKSQPDYAPNETHCLYGLDADLIMLSLVSHEPHFTLLREVVQFGGKPDFKKKQKKSKNNDQQQPTDPNAPREQRTLEEIVPPISQFQLLHISLLREYLDLEFSPLRLQFPDYSLERVIDDFVLLCFFVGNDFLPHLPTFDISEGSLNYVFEIYQRELPKLGGYLTDEGKIDFQRVELILVQLAKLEPSILNERVQERVKSTRRRARFRDSGQRSRNEVSDLSDFFQPSSFDVLDGEEALSGTDASRDYTALLNLDDDNNNDDEEEESTAEVVDNEYEKARRNLLRVLGLTKRRNAPLEISSENDTSFESSRSVFEFADFNDFDMDTETPFLKSVQGKHTGKTPSKSHAEKANKKDWEDVLLKSLTSRGDVDFKLYRRNYYNDKLNISMDDPEQMRSLVKHYIEGIIWVYGYYYRGCISWKWFYAHHYAPLSSDLINLAEIASSISFELSTPFLPYQQLMGVLPSRSSQCLPVPYRHLMWNQNSPIIDFYPSEFVVDREGTKAEWEGISLLPFIEETRLLEAMSTVLPSQLTPQEHFRNRSGNCLLFSWDPTVKPYFFDSTLPEVLPPIPACRCGVRLFQMPDGSNFKPRLVKGVVLPKGLVEPSDTVRNVDGLEGYPSFHTKTIESELRAIHLNLFGTLSKKDTCVIKVVDATFLQGDDIGRLVGTRIHVQWPYPREAIVSSIASEKESFFQAGSAGIYEKEVHSNFDRANFLKEAAMHQSVLMSRKGLDTGEIQYLIYVRLFDGFKKLPNGVISKKFADSELPFPLQLCVFNYKPLLTPSSLNRKDREDFRRNDEIIYLGKDYLGSRGTVVDIHAVSGTQFSILTLMLTVPFNEPNVMDALANQFGEMDLHWYGIPNVAHSLNISPALLSKITSSLRVVTQSGDTVELGLMIKLSKKNMCVKGFARKQIFASSNGDSTYYMNISTESSQHGGAAPDGNNGTRFLDRNNKFAMDTRDGLWELSDKTIQLLTEYKHRFPVFWDQIQRLNLANDLTDTALFPNGDAGRQIQEIQDWLALQPMKDIPLTPVDVDVLPQSAVLALESLLNKYEASPFSMEQSRITIGGITTYLVYNPRDPSFGVPQSSDEPQPNVPGDRVVSTAGSGLVPFGSRGTVIGRRGELTHVMFDNQFTGGLKYAGGETNRCALVPDHTLLNLNDSHAHLQHKPPVIHSIVHENLVQQQQTAENTHKRLPWVAYATKHLKFANAFQSQLTGGNLSSRSAPALSSVASTESVGGPSPAPVVRQQQSPATKISTPPPSQMQPVAAPSTPPPSIAQPKQRYQPQQQTPPPQQQPTPPSKQPQKVPSVNETAVSTLAPVVVLSSAHRDAKEDEASLKPSLPVASASTQPRQSPPPPVSKKSKKQKQADGGVDQPVAAAVAPEVSQLPSAEPASTTGTLDKILEQLQTQSKQLAAHPQDMKRLENALFTRLERLLEDQYQRQERAQIEREKQRQAEMERQLANMADRITKRMNSM